MSLERSPAEIMRALMVDGSGAAFSLPEDNEAWPTHVSSLPDGLGVKMNAAATYDIEGVQHGRLLASGRTLRSPGVQIRVRSVDYNVGWKKINDLAAALDAVKRRTVTVELSSFVVETIMPTSDPIYMGQDTNRRCNFSYNVVMAVAPA